MKIKDVEKQVGISKANLRFYEEEGLIHPAKMKWPQKVRQLF